MDLPFYLPGRILRVWGTLVGRPPLRFGQRRDGTREPRPRYGLLVRNRPGQRVGNLPWIGAEALDPSVSQK
jgi:hypothetical protein